MIINILFFLTFSIGQKLGSGLAGCFWPRVSHEIAFKLLAKGLGLGNPLSRWLIHIIGQLCWLLARGLSPSHVGLSIGLPECPHNMEIAFPRGSDLREITFFLWPCLCEVTPSLPPYSVCYKKVAKSSSYSKERKGVSTFWREECRRIYGYILKLPVVASLKMATQWSLPPDIHTFVYFPPILYHICCAWPVAYGEVMVCHFWS